MVGTIMSADYLLLVSVTLYGSRIEMLSDIFLNIFVTLYIILEEYSVLGNMDKIRRKNKELQKLIATSLETMDRQRFFRLNILL